MKKKEPTIREVVEAIKKMRAKGKDPFLKGGRGRVRLGFYRDK